MSAGRAAPAPTAPTAKEFPVAAPPLVVVRLCGLHPNFELLLLPCESNQLSDCDVTVAGHAYKYLLPQIPFSILQPALLKYLKLPVNSGLTLWIECLFFWHCSFSLRASKLCMNTLEILEGTIIVSDNSNTTTECVFLSCIITYIWLVYLKSSLSTVEKVVKMKHNNMNRWVKNFDC